MKVKMNYSTEVTKSVTAKYRYTIEVQHWDAIRFHLHYHDEMDCTPYDTPEEAQAAIHKTAMLWHWDERKVFLKKWESTETVLLHHRYKVKA